ncbi:27669_t:CDS:1, partial [Racocetra persica]
HKDYTSVVSKTPFANDKRRSLPPQMTKPLTKPAKPAKSAKLS